MRFVDFIAEQLSSGWAAGEGAGEARAEVWLPGAGGGRCGCRGVGVSCPGGPNRQGRRGDAGRGAAGEGGAFVGATGCGKSDIHRTDVRKVYHRKVR